LNWPEQLLGRHYCTTLDAMGSFFFKYLQEITACAPQDESNASDTVYFRKSRSRIRSVLSALETYSKSGCHFGQDVHAANLRRHAEF
jgi:hypothetical protein